MGQDAPGASGTHTTQAGSRQGTGGVPLRLSGTNLTSSHEDVGSVPDLVRRVYDLVVP